MNPKSVFLSKTMWVQIVTILIAAIVGIQNVELIQNNPQIVAAFVAVLGVLNAILRWLTVEPVTLTNAGK